MDILLVSIKSPRVRFYFRNAAGSWVSKVVIGMEFQIPMPLMGVTLSLGTCITWASTPSRSDGETGAGDLHLIQTCFPR